MQRLDFHLMVGPEIWQGHKKGGEGFWIALERLEGGTMNELISNLQGG